MQYVDEMSNPVVEQMKTLGERVSSQVWPVWGFWQNVIRQTEFGNTGQGQIVGPWG